MLDQSIINQLNQVYEPLEGKFELVVKKSDHPNQQELLEMLTQLANCSDKIQLVESNGTSDYPEFSIKRNQIETGISFRGIPGGHEFTSLVLSILNADRKGKLPDLGIQKRVSRLMGRIELKTYISLSCENCPEVVQALNQMAIFNSQLKHQMIDGQYAQDEIDELQIQGVPTVVCNDTVISIGKSNFSELLQKLEEHCGTEEAEEETDLGLYDVVVIGGGPAGASASIYSARKGLKTALITESVGGQVNDTKGIENLISVTYTEGPQLSAQLAQHIAEYPIDIFEQRRVNQIINGASKKLILSSSESIQTKAIIVSTGAKWRHLNIPGETEYMGRGVGFCPHCDGPFFKGKDVAVIGGGNSGVEAAIDLAGIVRNVILYEFMPELKADKVLIDKLHSLSNVRVITNAKTSKVIGNGSKVTGLEYENRVDGSINQSKIDGIFIQIGFMPNSDFLKGLVNINKFGEIIIDDKCRTNISGIYAAGDVTTVPFKQIIISMGEGAKAALTAFEEQMLAS